MGTYSWLLVVWMKFSIGKGAWFMLVLVVMGEDEVASAHVSSQEDKGD